MNKIVNIDIKLNKLFGKSNENSIFKRGDIISGKNDFRLILGEKDDNYLGLDLSNYKVRAFPEDVVIKKGDWWVQPKEIVERHYRLFELKEN